MNESKLKERKLKNLLRKTDDSEIASLKGTIISIIEIINDPKSNLNDLKELLQLDPPLTARVFRVANSPYYAAPRPLHEIEEAVVWIGFDALQEIVLTQKYSEILKNCRRVKGFSPETIWKHCLAVALLSKMIMRKEFGLKGNDAYAAGLLHDIGLIVEDQLQYDDFGKVMQEVVDGHQEILTAERSILGFDHADVGRMLAEHWNFPHAFADVIGSHHDPTMGVADDGRIVKVLYVADFLSFEAGFGYGKGTRQDKELFAMVTDELKLEPFALSLITEAMKEEMERIEEKGVFLR